MSVRLISRLLAAAFVALWAEQISAQETPLYSRAWFELGSVFSESTELDGFPGTTGDSKVRLHPGVRFGFGSDYDFTHYFSIDWEVSVLASSVDNASGLLEMDAVITQVPFLVNASLQYQNQTGFTPFVRIGAGFASTAINVDEARSSTTTVEGSDYDFVFAWQLCGGLKYEFRNRWGVGVLYKYLWTGDAEWKVEDEGIGGGDQELELDGMRSHAILAFVNYRF